MDVCCREHTLNLKFVEIFLECMSDELETIVMDDASWNAEAINNVVFAEFNYVMSVDFSEGDGFCSF